MPLLGFKIISGNFPKGKDIYFNRDNGKYVLKENAIFGAKNYHIEENISAMELITEQNQNSFLGKAGWGLAGSLLLGPLGLLAGVLSGGSGKEMCCAIEMYPEYKFVAALDVKAYMELQPIAKRNAAAGKILPDTDLLKKEPEPIPAASPTVAETPTTAAPAPKKKGVGIDDLPKLKQLLDEGIITEEEFAAAKKKALGI